MKVTPPPEQRQNAAHSTWPNRQSKAFRVVSATLLAAVFSFAHIAAEPLPVESLQPVGPVLRLAVVGDTGGGAGRVAAAIAKVHARDPIDAIVLTGDTFYPCGVRSADDSRWSLVEPLTQFDIPLFAVLGNHDYCGSSRPAAQVEATGKLRNWRMPARHYVLRSPHAELLFLDTTPAVRGEEDLEKIFDDAFKQEKRRWRIVIGHHPILSSGWHGHFPRDEVRRMRELRPTLYKHGVDLYICGHDHHVELIRDRILYLVSGSGSRPIPPIRLRPHTIFPNEIRREPLGSVIVEISEVAIRFRMYDGAGRPRSEWLSGVGREPVAE